MTTSCQICTAPAKISAASNACRPARTRSVAIMIRLRGRRSAHTPPISSSRTSGSVCAASTRLRSVGEPVVCVTNSAIATTTTRSPTMLADWPKKKNLKSRWRRTRRYVLIRHSRQDEAEGQNRRGRRQRAVAELRRRVSVGCARARSVQSTKGSNRLPRMATQVSARLDPEIFRLPVQRIREGYYSDAYFVYTKSLLEAENHHPRVTMQVFQKNDSVLGGIDEAIAILKTCAGHEQDGNWVLGWDALEVLALREGDRIAPRETVMTIEGDYSLFAHLETVYLGCLARRSLVMRNVSEVVAAANGKQIFYFPARHDHWLVQTGDGWSAHVAGAIGVSTDAQASWWGGRGIGTVPHALIAAFGGDTVAAAEAFAGKYANEMNVTVLVDFENDSVKTALQVAEALGPKLWGVRLDTSEKLVDRALLDEMGEFKPTGVAPQLVRKVRAALDEAGYPAVKIVASGGFTASRIGEFEAEGVPVDAYGVGSSLIRGENDFTADVVMVEGRPGGKVGRRFKPNPRLEL